MDFSADHEAVGHATEGEHPEGAGHAAEGEHKEAASAEGGHGGHSYAAPGDYPDAKVDERGYIHRKVYSGFW
jgi:hypothetical protein